MSNIYLISSSSIHLLEEEVQKIIKDNISETIDLNNISLNQVLEEASFISLFDTQKYLVIKNADLFTTNTRSTNSEKISSKDNKLIKYLENPNDHTTLIFTTNNKIDHKKKIVKLIAEHYSLIELPDLKAREIYDKVAFNLKKEDYKIDKDTLYYIINNSLNNYDIVLNEIAKIKLYYQDEKNIKLDDVKQIVSSNLIDNNFKFTDAVMSKDIINSYKTMDDLLLLGTPPLDLMGMLARLIRHTLLVKKLINNHSKTEVMRLLSINSPYMLDKIINNMNLFTEKELEDFLILICDFNYQFKSGQIDSKLALELIVMQICK